MRAIPAEQVLLVQQATQERLVLVLQAVAPAMLAAQVRRVLTVTLAQQVLEHQQGIPVMQVELELMVQQAVLELMVLAQPRAVRAIPALQVMLVQLPLQHQIQIQLQISRIARLWRTLWGRVQRLDHFYSLGQDNKEHVC
jgi:hypothetical protein